MSANERNNPTHPARRGPLAKASQAQRLRDRADLAMWAMRPDEAFAHASAALELDPADASARLMQARVQLERSRPGDALRTLDAAEQFGLASTQDDPDTQRSAETMRLRAASLAATGKWSLAIGQLEALLALRPTDRAALRALAAVQLRDDRPGEAIETFTLLYDLDPGDGVVARALSDLLAERAGAPSQAVEALGRRDGGDPLRAARRCVEAGRLLEAESRYAELLGRYGQEAWLWLEAGRLAMAMGELTRAEERLMNAIETSDGQAELSREAWSELATQAMRRGRVAAAGRAWWRSIRVCGSPYPEGWAGLLTCAMVAERPNVMRRADRVLRSLTTRAQRRSLLAQCWLEVGPAAAQGTLGRSGERRGASSPLDGLLGEAARTLRETTERFPGRADARFHFAQALAAQGELAPAVEQVGAALSINPKYASAGELCDRLSLRLAA